MNEQRDARGHFLPGNQAAKGRGGPRRLTLLRNAAINTMTPDDVVAAMNRLYEIGMEGDRAALVEWLKIAGVTGEGLQNEALDRLEELLERPSGGE